MNGLFIYDKYWQKIREMGFRSHVLFSIITILKNRVILVTLFIKKSFQAMNKTKIVKLRNIVFLLIKKQIRNNSNSEIQMNTKELLEKPYFPE